MKFYFTFNEGLISVSGMKFGSMCKKGFVIYCEAGKLRHERAGKGKKKKEGKKGKKKKERGFQA